jgi:5-methylcytosine-specific restriction endonuclease McrA
LIDEGVLFPECAICQRCEWNGLPIALELDHVNGDRTDNRLANLRLLCPNCHAQTDTYRGRNIGRAADPDRGPLGTPSPSPRDLAVARLHSILSPRRPESA